MKLQMMSVFDRALGAYMQPWFAQSKGQAQRMFTDEINNPQGDMHKHPEDYALFHLGEWDNETGALTKEPINAPEQIATGANCIIRPT